jgi:hypothetical protein
LLSSFPANTLVDHETLGDVERVVRVKSDYQETLDEMLLENFLLPLRGWAHARGSRSRNQAHGSPGNVLEVAVTNLSANRIRDLDVRGVSWKNFHDINYVGLDYKPFDASKWLVRASGLIGPVTLTPLVTDPPQARD